MSANSRLINLQEKIQQIQTSLSGANKSETPIPELIESTNLLRSNEFLIKINQKQNELLSTYEEYVSELKKMISTTLLAQISSLRKSQKKSKKPKRKWHSNYCSKTNFWKGNTWKKMVIASWRNLVINNSSSKI